MHYILFFIFTFFLAILTNYLRFKGNINVNKAIFILSTLILIKIYGFTIGFEDSKWLFLMFIGISAISYRYIGGVISSIFAWIHLYITGVTDISILLDYLLFAITVTVITDYIIKSRKESDCRLDKLIHNSKQLNVFRDISYSMQQALHLQKLLHTILTSVTAGYGLGFNRAMIMLIDDEGTKLKGMMGTGPMSVEEGFATWESITKSKLKLQDLIKMNEIADEPMDNLLNERVKKIEISLQDSNFITRTLNSGVPLHIEELIPANEVSKLFVREFNMSEMAIFPLIYQGIKVGVLIIDNPVNKKPITPAAIDSVIPLANQAAIAIQNTRLYTKIEDLAIKDGLTGLFNQRAFQQSLEQYFPQHREAELAVILLDIDYFKHFNDRNGHLLGNQVLMKLAEVIKANLLENHLAFRFGGEEFVILLPSTDLIKAECIAEEIRKHVESTKFPCGENQPNGRLTISLGVASTKGHIFNSGHELVDAADKALYKAKADGKNRVVLFEGASIL